VSRVWNVNDFQHRLSRLFASARDLRATLNSESRSSSTEPSRTDQEAAEQRRQDWLECHARDFFIDHLLGALNWQKAPQFDAHEYLQNNVTIEQHTDFGDDTTWRDEDEKRKRMDYFGFERATDQPLLIVEAKRPRLRLPQGTCDDIATVFRNYLVRSRNRSYNARPIGLIADWVDCLDQIRLYARDVFVRFGRWPKRVAVSNGEWLVIFVEPETAFGTLAATSAGMIVICDSWDAISQNADVIWKYLEYRSLTSHQSQCEPSELPFLIDPEAVESCMFAVKVLYARKPSHYQREPCIFIVPELILKSSGVSFMRTGFPGWEDELPSGNGPLAEHLRAVETEALRLKRRVEELLGRGELPLIPVGTHMRDVDAFKLFSTVSQLVHKGSDGELAVLAVTGSETHFLSSSEQYQACVHHHHSESLRINAAYHQHAISRPSVENHSHFTDGSEFHCTHREVFTPKRQPVTEDNRERCGPRSSSDSGAFCELWRFEQMLCCRTCVYQEVCLSSSVFRIPCPQPITIGGVAAEAASDAVRPAS
jgi:hypothetical protein